MEVTEQSTEGLDKRFLVKVPASELDEKLVSRLSELKGQVHLKGFRKGKAPVSFLKKMYGKGVMSEIVQELVAETSQKAFSDRDLRPAAAPHPHFHSNMEDVLAGKADLEYDVHAEVLPEFEPMDIATLELTRPVADIPDEDVDEALQRLADQQVSYKPRGKTAKAKDKDQVVIDFVGRLDGEEFEGGKGEGHELVLGSGAFIPGFEDQLIGAKTGDALDVTVTFPEEYGATDLAGKEAVFAVTVNEVRAPEKVEIDDELAKKIGLETLDELKERLKERIEADYAQMSRAHVKRALLDKLDAAHDFELPKGMVDAEFEQIWRQVESSERDEEDKDKTEEELKADYRSIAERRVRLGLVLAEIGKKASVQVPANELQQAIQQQAIREAQMMQMSGQNVTPQQVLEFFQQNPGAIEQIRAPLYEEHVVDHILGVAKVEEKKVSKDKLMEEPEGEDVTA